MSTIQHSQVQHLHYTKLADHRGGKRVYLQTPKLAEVGLGGGAPFTVEFLPQKIRLVATEAGDRHVCQRQRGDRVIPVVDISGQHVAETFGVGDAMGGATRVRVSYRAGVVEIDLHPIEAAIADREARLRRAAASGTLTTGSLCTGIGVLDGALHSGLARAGYDARTLFTVELDEEYSDHGHASNPALRGAMSVVGSLDEIEADLLPQVDILDAGLPCTGASLSGRSKKGLAQAEDDPLVGHLFVPFLEVIKRTNPGIVLLENVPPYQGTASMAVIRTCLDRLGYRLFEFTLDGQQWALEDRKRMCLLAISRGIAPEDFEVRATRRNHVLSEILEDVDLTSERWKEAAYLVAKAERDAADGKGFKTQIVGPDAEKVGTIGRGYSKWRSTEPRLQHPTDPTLTRLLTPREHARVKGIPEELVDGLCSTTAHEVLGQSIIAPAFASVGEAVGEHLYLIAA